VPELRYAEAKFLEQVDLARRVADVIVAAQDMADLHETVIDDVREVVNNTLTPVQTGVDAMGNPIIQRVAPSMSAAGANASDRFFDIFAAGGTHFGRLSADELRLISEWLDIGAQYYNNPFDVPNQITPFVATAMA